MSGPFKKTRQKQKIKNVFSYHCGVLLFLFLKNINRTLNMNGNELFFILKICKS